MEWDIYFMNLAYVARKRSNCMKRRYEQLSSVGCIIAKNKRIVSVGFNGCTSGLKNCFQGGCERCNSDSAKGVDLHKCFCLHAEEAAIFECGLQNSKDGTLYVTLFPCLMCAKVIVHAVVSGQQGIKEIYYAEDYAADNSVHSRACLNDCGIAYTKVDPSRLNVGPPHADPLGRENRGSLASRFKIIICSAARPMAEKQVMEISPGIILHKQQVKEQDTLLYHFKIEVKKMNVVEFVADFTGSENIEIEGRSNLISVTTIDPFSSATIARLVLRRDWKLKSKFK